jgi:hypothetical protein
MTGRGHNPFAADEDAALSASALVWGSHYQV